ncbi:hypothetical protein SUGI_0706220 [Cryptomeria japonica]|nr:hypothetical protein SUGI_0706220 [Cryptomeria japonica]
MKKDVVEYLEENHILKANDLFKRSDLEKALIGLKVTVKHRETKQKFTVVEVTEKAARDIKFKVDGGDVEKSIMDHYNDRYGKRIIKMKLPCLNLGKKAGRQNYVPMDFCEICEG